MTLARTCVSWIAVAACGSGTTPAPPEAGPPAATWPPASAGHDLVYIDTLGGVVLINAGLGGATMPAAETPSTLWSWDGARWTVLDTSGPPIRNLGGAAYDAAHDELVVYGGTYSATVSYADTWTWKSGRGWKRIDAAGGPGIRDHVQMTYDRTRAQVVLFGGQATVDDFPATTWTWNGAQWSELTVTPSPSPRVHHAMTYDAAAAAVVVFGGTVPAAGDLGDTWTFDGSAWTQSGPAITPRTHARMAHDGNRAATIVVGGGAAADAILVRDGASWRPLGIAGAPPARYLTGVAYDATRRVLVVFGGGSVATDRLLDDLWELDAAAWHRVDRSAAP